MLVVSRAVTSVLLRRLQAFGVAVAQHAVRPSEVVARARSWKTLGLAVLGDRPALRHEINRFGSCRPKCHMPTVFSDVGGSAGSSVRRGACRARLRRLHSNRACTSRRLEASTQSSLNKFEPITVHHCAL